jgi:hypothetical protein
MSVPESDQQKVLAIQHVLKNSGQTAIVLYAQECYGPQDPLVPAEPFADCAPNETSGAR